MQFRGIIYITLLTMGVGASVLFADCPYDHFLVGQDGGTLFLDTSQLYRHWNVNWSANPNPFGRQYYEFTEMYGGGYIRVEPGFSENTDPAFAFSGMRGVDYNIVVERVYATAGLQFFDDTMSPILAFDGDFFVLSGYPNHHVHMRYYLPDGLDPTLSYKVSYRLTDTTGSYADSEICTFFLGDDEDIVLVADINGDSAVNISDFLILKSWYGTSSGATHSEGDLDGDGDVDISDFLILKSQYGASI